MRDYLEAAVIANAAQLDWVNPWLERHTTKKMQFSLFQLEPEAKPNIVADMSWLLMRFDAVILPLTVKDLPWARLMLSHTQQSPLKATAMFAVANQVAPIAVYDLLRLGLHGYCDMHNAYQEMRVRLLQTLDQHQQQQQWHSGQHAGPKKSRLGTYGLTPAASAHYELTPAQAPQLQEHQGAYFTLKYADWHRKTFKSAKQEIVNEFEQRYIAEALRRSHGNIALAARNVQKHRRAFWQLMKKYNIKAEAYKDEA
ncbi:helix-turn-helix domain-containing protein [Brackiella oedipodis]|uniref:helix-turn-helix domain-containing protein n=1 Tax=Brackiella oedipodis TaxID=124225 RepID=UPI000491968D|nr:helix-turn-helix domain-containing protein [Brackiella oedipodis]